MKQRDRHTHENTMHLAAPSDAPNTSLRILEAAHHLFTTYGYHGASMRRIASETGISLSSVYNHFPSKRKLFAAVFFKYHPYKEVLSALESAAGSNLEEMVRDAANRMLATVRHAPDFINLMFIEIVEMHGEHLPELVDVIMPRLTQAILHITQSSDQLRTIPTPVLMRAFVGMFFSYVITEQMFSAEVRAFFPPDTLNHFVDIFLHGIVTHDSEA